MSPKTIEVVYRKLNDIRPYWKNPRINEHTIEALVEVIPVIGFNVPIVIDKEGVIVKGHARYGAAVRLHLEEIPCIISENDDETNKLDRIADNKVFELSAWDYNEIKPLEPNMIVGEEAKAERQPARRYSVVCPYCNTMVEIKI